MVKANDVILTGAIDLTPTDLLWMARKFGRGEAQHFITSVIKAGIERAFVKGKEVEGELSYIFLGYVTLQIIIRSEIGIVEIIYTE